MDSFLPCLSLIFLCSFFEFFLFLVGISSLGLWNMDNLIDSFESMIERIKSEKRCFFWHLLLLTLMLLLLL